MGGQMIVEYIGEVIRGELTDLREKRYESQNRGIYMFRLDDYRVVDATMTGGVARYINHCCEPNCVTETVELADWHIIIFANRRISRGEELSYDYKFDFEDDNKIPCLCGAKNCRKWMNLMLWNFSVWSKTVPPRWQSIVILVLSNAAVALFTQMFVQIPIMKQINMTLPK